MARRSSAWAAMVAAARAAVIPYPVVEMDLYGALPSSGPPSSGLENTNMMSLMGVLKHIHTDIITEHEVSPAERQRRRNDVEVISRARFRIKNPPRVVADPGKTETMVSNVDFGPYMTFQNGAITSTFQTGLIQRHGDMVGVQEIRDERFVARDPFYWFSFSGWCPNQPDSKKPNRTWLQLDANRELCQNRNEAQCPNATCHWEWSGDWLTSCNLATDIIPQCANYSNTSGVLGKIRGGLCPGGASTLTVTPTGEFGCAYSYGPLQSVSLDRLTGILDEDCGGRKCSDWLDFRLHCTNEKYKRKFEGDESHGWQPFNYCVEYDIHQACASSCRSRACRRLPEEERELGLPFWRGRCSAKANQVRAEKLAAAFGIEGGHQLVSKEMQALPPTCVHKVPGFCTPAPGQGGMYCSRHWGGVCQPCYIPGTVEPYQAVATPLCPYNILEQADYKGKFPPPRCSTKQARDLCCLYTRDCEVMDTDPLLAPLDDDGLALVAMNQSTAAMATFLERAVQKSGRERTMSNLLNFAYYEWGSNPRKGRTLKNVFADMTSQGHLLPPGATTTTKYPPQLPTTSSAPVVAEASTPAVAREAGSGFPWWAWLLIAAGILLLGGLAFALCMFFGGGDGGGSEKKKKKKSGKSKRLQAAARAEADEVAAPLVPAGPPAAVAVPMQAPLPTTAVPVAMYTTTSPQSLQVSQAYQVIAMPTQVVAPVPATGSQVVASAGAPSYGYRVA